MDPRIKALNDRHSELNASMEALLAKATMTEDEGKSFDEMLAERDAIPAKIAAVEQQIAAEAARKAAFEKGKVAPAPRRAAPETQGTVDTSKSGGHVRITHEYMSADQISALPEERKPYVLKADNGGFKTLSEQLLAIAVAESSNSRTVDPRLSYSTVTPSAAVSGAGAGSPVDGGYLIQKDIMTDLMDKSFGGDEVLSRVRRFGCSANSDGLTMNLVDETSRVVGSRWGGVQVYYGAEADSATAKKPKFRQEKWELKDVIGLMYATDRLLADASALGSVFSEAFASEMRFFVADGVINGTGGGQLTGILNAGALVSVAKETNQAANTIVFENINKMWSRMWSRSRGNAVWLINQDCEPALDGMAAPVGTGGIPAYLPPGGLSQTRFASLKGAPVIPTEFNPTLGTVGDIMLVDLSQYLVVDKGGIQSDSSIHVRFINNERTFRWLYRVDGRPLWNSALTPAKGSNTLSPFVALATRS